MSYPYSDNSPATCSHCDKPIDDDSKWDLCLECANADKRCSAATDFIEDHPYGSKQYGRLTEAERKILHGFLNMHAFLSKDDFQSKVNRMHLEKPRTEHWSMIEEILSCINSATEIK